MVPTQTVSVTEFKAKCLSLFDEVEAGRLSITVTRRGKVIGIIHPPPLKQKFKSSQGAWAGKIELLGDIMNTDTSDLWDVVNGRELPAKASAKAASRP